MFVLGILGATSQDFGVPAGGRGASLQEHSFFGFMTESHNKWKDYAL